MATMINPEDQGHRHGNFPNYYTFHPPGNRLNVLYKSGMLNYIFLGMESAFTGVGRDGKHHDDAGFLSMSRCPTEQQTTKCIDNANDEEDNEFDKKIMNNRRDGVGVETLARKRQRREDCKTVHNPNENFDGRPPLTLYYCDLGCNEGDLTMEMARALATMTYHEGLKREVAQYASVEKLENHVNNECPFDPVSSLSGKKRSNINFIREKGEIMKNFHVVKCLGLDLDPMLIKRAKDKFTSSGVDPLKSTSNSAAKALAKNDNHGAMAMMMSASFQVCNLCSESEHHDACTLFFHTNLNQQQELEERDQRKNDNSITEIEMLNNKQSIATHPFFHLTTIFSTTMWIHLHSGDEGLRQFLERACSWTKKFLLVEPQPSACYRKANTRLRKMGRPELNDVTSNRLKMRPDIEAEIEKIIIQCGFRKVSKEDVISCMPLTRGGSVEENDAAITAWNRSLHLYERNDTEYSASLS